ncbi:small integral membrane protein 14-like [Biomphalaria glabrata]|uniref:Small integral membrane protein 14 n=2 Tax=Biomphalaria TaxID=6525 RepID=A0A9W2YFF7_BIOGL|nr:small integral membrane protein 14-like [Biomphalaria glabrata]KAI8753832.1 small integral membrane protein 14 [Biomphalaria glabrata]KAK0058833.1 small integral membrane protein 14 [Biomphalaria pfeifferi]
MAEFDPCECIDAFQHENVMRRLLNLLRDSQNVCTDNGCDNLPTSPQAPNCAEGYMLLMLGWFVVATLLFLLRPKTLRLRGDGKPAPSGGGSTPPPAPSVN